MFEPSAQIESLLTTIAAQPSAAEGMRAMLQRAPEFPSLWQAQLTGIAVDPAGRDLANQLLDAAWADEAQQQTLLHSGGAVREVIIGSGVHAAVYAAIRVLSGHPRPLVLERAARVGGTFAMTARPTFHLNSRNRAGSPGLAGDQSASLNYLPGAPIQAAAVSMREYQTNTDLAFVIRLALAQFADVVTNAEVTGIVDEDPGIGIQIAGRDPLVAGRVIDARGLGDPADQGPADSVILTFPQFMQRMAGRWPLRGVRRVAVIGGGDAGKCAVESCLGLAPQPPMAAAALDQVEQIDWYAETLPTTCDAWQQRIRGRYQPIGRYLRPDRRGLQRLTVLDRRARPVALPGSGLIDGRTYDLIVMCTGYQERRIEGLEYGALEEYRTADGLFVARRDYRLPVFRIGPHARLPFTTQERVDGVADIDANVVAIFRTTPATATLAATLPTPTQD